MPCCSYQKKKKEEERKSQSRRNWKKNAPSRLETKERKEEREEREKGGDFRNAHVRFFLVPRHNGRSSCVRFVVIAKKERLI